MTSSGTLAVRCRAPQVQACVASGQGDVTPRLARGETRLCVPQVGGMPAAYFTMPCMRIQLTKASNQPVLVVVFGYMPKPCPPCS